MFLSMSNNLLRRALALTLLWVLGLGGLAVADAAEPDPIVAELYTSQGCNTCPPADTYLGELTQQDGVIALSFHVNYWDYIGWPDPYASEESTGRQYAYARALGRPNVYTPQMIIHGSTHEVGSRRDNIEGIIARARDANRDRVPVSITRDDDGGLAVHLPAAHIGQRAAVWMVLIDDKHSTPIRAGENAGKTLSYHNVVREIRRIGTWEGAALEIPLSITSEAGETRDGCVVIVQPEGLGPILGAAMVRL